jgi:hypothetical protein
VRFEVLTAVKIPMLFFWVVTPCRTSVLKKHTLSFRVSVLMMEAVSASETSVNIYQTTLRNNPEDS